MVLAYTNTQLVKIMELFIFYNTHEMKSYIVIPVYFDYTADII